MPVSLESEVTDSEWPFWCMNKDGDRISELIFFLIIDLYLFHKMSSLTNAEVRKVSAEPILSTCSVYQCWCLASTEYFLLVVS